MRQAFLWLNLAFLIYFVIVNGFYLMLMILSYGVVDRYARLRSITEYDGIFDTTFFKPVSVIVPAHNEAATIVDTVESVLAVRYPELEAVVVNDGSSDETMEILKETYSLVPCRKSPAIDIPCNTIIGVWESTIYPRLLVVDKENGGKADALNAGINVCSYPLVCNIDADSIIDGQSMVQVTRPFLEDYRVVAVGGVVMPANDCVIEGGVVKEVRLARHSLARLQLVEYLRAFLFGRLGWSRLNSLMIISGAFAVFRKTALVEVGGYRRDTVGEDMELVLRMHREFAGKRKPYRIDFVPDPICWTQVPEDLKSLGKQRRRWHKGLAESLSKNSSLCFNPKYGIVGMLGYPFFLIGELFSPAIELGGYGIVAATLITHALNWKLSLMFLAASMLLGTLLSTSSLYLEQKAFNRYPGMRYTLVLLGYALLETLGYRQLHCVWRCLGLFDFCTKRGGWGKAARKAF